MNRSNRALDIVEKYKTSRKTLSLERFINEFENTSSNAVFPFFDKRIKELEQAGKIGNMNAYKTARSALWRYRPQNTIQFTDIDYKFLHGWEVFLRKEGCTNGGISNYMRTFRALYNLAIKFDIVDYNSYPFSNQINKKGYSIKHLKKETIPNVMNLEEMDRFKQFDTTEYPNLATSYWMFMFSYYARGIDFVDLAYLQWSDVSRWSEDSNEKSYGTYHRKKTGKQIQFQVTKAVDTILEKFEENRNDTDLIFPIIDNPNQPQKKVRDRIKQYLKKYNKHLRQIADILEINVYLTSKVVRHTYATTLLRKDTKVAVISEAMGHSDIKTTETYLAKFKTSIIDETDNLL